MKCYVGVDTSNYTTSVGIVDADGGIIANVKRLLPVADGACGLRQSDAVFAHVKNLPLVFREAASQLEDAEILGIGYSARPRNAEGSYMPCFLCGAAAAEAFAAGHGLSPIAFSHQCGHVSAALTSAGVWEIADAPFLAFHVSGGTTEVLLCQKSEDGFLCEIVGGTRDLNAGQTIDRAGVMMGMQFPCGAALETTAATYTGRIEKPRISVGGATCNLSGLQNIAEKCYRESGDAAKTSALVLDFVGRTLLAMAKGARAAHGDLPILFAGGVMSNKRIGAMLASLGNVYFAEPQLSSDNAVGIAELTRRKCCGLLKRIDGGAYNG